MFGYSRRSQFLLQQTWFGGFLSWVRYGGMAGLGWAGKRWEPGANGHIWTMTPIPTGGSKKDKSKHTCLHLLVDL